MKHHLFKCLDSLQTTSSANTGNCTCRPSDRVRLKNANYANFLGEIVRLERPIDLYHAAAILSPRGTKSFVFARPASHWMRGWTGKIFCFSIA